MPSLAQVLARPSAFSSAGERSSRLLGGDMPPQNPNFAVTGIAHLQGESICRAPQPARPFAPVTDFRYNTRISLGFNDMQRTEKLARGAVGKRLTYQRTRQQPEAETPG